MRPKGFLLCACLLLCAPLAAADALRVPYPRTDASADNDYFINVLKLSLAKAGAGHTVAEVRRGVRKGRAIRELGKDKEFDVIWAVTSVEREAEAIPVRIPLDKGLSGWRIAFVRARDAGQFKHVRTLEQLRGYIAGQGFDWVDTAILRANALPVTTGGEYNALSRMLALGRFDYFPRSIREVWEEADKRPQPGVVVDQYIVLQYPSAVYFFVAPDNPGLAATIRSGLELAYRDGSFDSLFERYRRTWMARAKLQQRAVIQLENPALPPGTPLAEKRYWYQPAKTAVTTPSAPAAPAGPAQGPGRPAAAEPSTLPTSARESAPTPVRQP